MSTSASGTFEVKMTPQDPDPRYEGAPLGRMKIDKQFRGDLEAVSCGEMLGAGAPAQGSAGYVALERVVGALHGRSGTFVLQHSGTINRGVPGLTVTVVPGSGTGELSGLAGSMQIVIEGGKHSYVLDYELQP